MFSRYYSRFWSCRDCFVSETILFSYFTWSIPVFNSFWALLRSSFIFWPSRYRYSESISASSDILSSSKMDPSSSRHSFLLLSWFNTFYMASSAWKNSFKDYGLVTKKSPPFFYSCRACAMALLMLSICDFFVLSIIIFISLSYSFWKNPVQLLLEYMVFGWIKLRGEPRGGITSC